MPGSDASVDEVRPRLRALGEWAGALRIEGVPEDVRELARRQLAHIDRRIAAVYAAGVDVPASNARPAAAYAAFEGDSHILGGRIGVGIAVLRSLAADPQLTVERLVLATVIGLEIGARVGLATLISDRVTSSSPRPGAAAGAAALSWLGGASGPAIGDAVVAAVGLASTAAVADGVGFGAAVGEAALGGFTADGATEDGDFLRGVADPLLDALAAPGNGAEARWLTRALILPDLCAPVALATGVEGLSEVLRRHVKAAEKRLRAEQVERIEIRVPWVSAAAEAARPRMAELVGRLVAFHDLGPAERANAGQRAGEIAAVAERVVVIHDWGLTVGFASSALSWTGPMSLARIRALRGVFGPRGAWPTLQLEDVSTLARTRADRLFRRSAPIGDVRPLSWPVQIRLYTTRGGWWPERRHLADSTSEPLVAPFDAPLGAPAGPLLGLT